MLRRFTIDEQQARCAIQHGEFDSEVVASSPCVAVVLTQGWCSEWFAMDAWLRRLIEQREPRDMHVDVWTLLYDQVSYFREFLQFKESVFGNYRIPYIRYYSKGRPFGESNFVQAAEFLSRFTTGHEANRTDDVG